MNLIVRYKLKHRIRKIIKIITHNRKKQIQINLIVRYKLHNRIREVRKKIMKEKEIEE